MSNSTRDYRFDNLKGILIFLVVLGHTTGKLYGNSLMITGSVHSLIYSFHMPAFIILSGLFSKKNHNHEQYSKKQVKSLLIPFIIAHLLMWIITSRKAGSLFNPCWTLWYLLSLLIWRMLVVPISKFRHSIILSFLASLLVGFSPADQLFSISRTVAFFPLFLIGYKTTITDLFTIGKVKKTIPAMILILLFSIVIILEKKGVPAIAYTMNKPYKSFKGFTQLQAMAFRMSALLIGIISTYCLFFLVPQKQTLISVLGRNSMTVYLAHSFCLLGIEQLVSFISPAFFSIDIIVLLLSCILSIIICLLFGNTWIAEKYNRFLDWVATIVLVNDSHVIDQTK